VAFLVSQPQRQKKTPATLWGDAAPPLTRATPPVVVAMRQLEVACAIDALSYEGALRSGHALPLFLDSAVRSLVHSLHQRRRLLAQVV
jgi:hypothetical protein